MQLLPPSGETCPRLWSPNLQNIRGPSFRHQPWLLTDSSRILGSPSRIIHSLYSTILHYYWVYLHGPHESFCGSKMIKAAKIHGIQTSARLYLYVKRQCCHLSLKVCHWLSGRKEANGQSATQDSVASQHGEIAKTFGYHEIDWRILKAMLPKSRCLPLRAFSNTSPGRGVNLQDLRDLSWETYPVPNDITDLVDWSIICHLIIAEGSQKKLVWGLQHHLKQKVLVSKKYAWESRLQALSTGITCNSYVQLRYTRNIPWVASWPWARFARNWLVPTPVAGSGLPPTRRTAATAARNATGAMSLGSRELIGCWIAGPNMLHLEYQ